MHRGSDEEVCYTFDEYAQKLSDEANESFVKSKHYAGGSYHAGEYSILADKETGSWTLVLDPYNASDVVPDTTCLEQDHVFHVDGDNTGFPTQPYTKPWHSEIFGGPRQYMAKLEN